VEQKFTKWNVFTKSGRREIKNKTEIRRKKKSQNKMKKKEKEKEKKNQNKKEREKKQKYLKKHTQPPPLTRVCTT
jgi:hypothetical protein